MNFCHTVMCLCESPKCNKNNLSHWHGKTVGYSIFMRVYLPLLLHETVWRFGTHFTFNNWSHAIPCHLINQLVFIPTPSIKISYRFDLNDKIIYHEWTEMKFEFEKMIQLNFVSWWAIFSSKNIRIFQANFVQTFDYIKDAVKISRPVKRDKNNQKQFFF